MNGATARELVAELGNLIDSGAINPDAAVIVQIDGVDHAVTGAIEGSFGDAVKLDLDPDRS